MLRLAYHALVWLLAAPLTLLRAAYERLRPRRLVLEVVLEGRHPLRPRDRLPFSGRRTGITRRSLAWALRHAADDPAVEAIWLRIGRLGGGFGELHALRTLITRYKRPGRRIIAQLSQGDTRALYLASAADEIVISPHLTVDAAGLGVEQTFFGGALEKLGVGFDVLAAGSFKSAMETLTRRGPSEPAAEALDALVGDLFETVVAALAERPGHTAEAVRNALLSGPYTAEEALAAGLVDRLVEEEAVARALDCHPDGKAARVRAEDYAGPHRALPRWRVRRPRLGVVELHGNIADGPLDDRAPPPGANATAVVASLERAAQDKRIKGVLLHVDSRGGSATGSERMWRAVRALAEKKPVIAYMSDYAASGGYYIASAAQGIVAAPGTLTGSIGVIAAKPNAAGLFAKLDIAHARFERGENANLFSPARPLSEGQRERLLAAIRQFYALFLRRVAEGRGKTPEDIAPVAEGRVWTGAQAHARGLVDRLGDEQAAIEWVAERAGVDPHAGLLLLTPRLPFAQRLMRGLGAAARLDALTEAAALLDELRLLDGAPAPLAYAPWRLSGR